jgi:hypothetical protein
VVCGRAELLRRGEQCFVQVLADGVPQLAKGLEVTGATVPLPVEGLDVPGLATCDAAGGEVAGSSLDELRPALALAEPVTKPIPLDVPRALGAVAADIHVARTDADDGDGA